MQGHRGFPPTFWPTGLDLSPPPLSYPSPPPQASDLDASLPLPHLGLAQWWLTQGLQEGGGAINASSELERAIRAAPAFYDALKVRARRGEVAAKAWEGRGQGRKGTVRAQGSQWRGGGASFCLGCVDSHLILKVLPLSPPSDLGSDHLGQPGQGGQDAARLQGGSSPSGG